MTVISPETEHHEGGGSRLIPLFPELLPHLEAVFDQAEPGTTHVITRYRSASVNLRTQFTKIIKRASLKQWPKLFHNLRATRQTELADSYPAHVVCSWLGNTKGVAMKHYLQTTEEHFEAATISEQKATAPKAAQNAAQSVHATARNEQKEGCKRNPTAQRKPPVLQGETSVCGVLQVDGVNPLVGVPGFEPGTSALSGLRSNQLSYTPVFWEYLSETNRFSKYLSKNRSLSKCCLFSKQNHTTCFS